MKFTIFIYFINRRNNKNNFYKNNNTVDLNNSTYLFKIETQVLRLIIFILRHKFISMINDFT